MIDSLKSIADLLEIEKTPLNERLNAFTTFDLLADAANRFADRSALTFLANGEVNDAPQTWTYREFFEAVLCGANFLHRSGARPGRSVSLLMPNLPETHFALWGGQAASIANPINPLLNIDEIATIMRAADASHLVAPSPAIDAKLWEKAQAAHAAVGGDVDLLVAGPKNDFELPAGAAWFDIADPSLSRESLESGRKINPDDIAAYFHTGGTTGTPKLAQHTHYNEVSDGWMAGYSFGFEEGDVTLTGLPLFHANASIISGITALSVGVHVVLAGKDGFRNKQTIQDFWRLVEKFGVTNFSAVPTIYAALMDVPIGALDISSLRFCICGAAPMPTSLFRKFEKQTGITIYEAYGMTEGTCVSTCNPRDGEKRIGSIGIRLPYQEIKTVTLNEEGEYLHDAPPNETGVLCLRGPNVIPGYKQEEANKNIWAQPGWLNTGDLARIDEDGYVWLTGRAKDLIIRGGHNIDPQMIEDAIGRHPAVEIAAAIGKPDAYAGEVPIAYVVVKECESVSEEDLLAFARAEVSERPAVPSEIVIMEQLPVTAVGKLFKPALRMDAIKRVVISELEQRGLNAEVKVRHEKRTGFVASIKCADQKSASVADVREALGKYSFASEFSPD